MKVILFTVVALLGSMFVATFIMSAILNISQSINKDEE